MSRYGKNMRDCCDSPNQANQKHIPGCPHWKPTEEEERYSIVMEEIVRRLSVAREALFLVRMDSMLRDGNITKDTQAQVDKAFELLS